MSMILFKLRLRAFQPVAHRRYRFSGLLPMVIAVFALAALLVLAPHAEAQAVSGSVAVPPLISTFAGDGTACASSTGPCGDDGAATSAELNTPAGVAVDSSGNVYIADAGNQLIWKVAASTDIITKVAGNGTACPSSTAACGDGSAATSAELNTPIGVTLDTAGNLYIADAKDNRIRMVAAATGTMYGGTLSTTAGDIYTVAGNGTAGYSRDNIAATSAELNQPTGVALDRAGNLYIADQSNQRIRKIDTSTGIISTVAGDGTSCANGTDPCGYGGPATSSQLGDPDGVAVDSAGNIYIADQLNATIRMVAAANGTMFGGTLITTAGDIYIVAGNRGSCGSLSSCGDGGAATSAELSNPVDVAVDSANNFYIVDLSDYAIRKVMATTGIITTVAGNGTACSSSTSACGDGGAATNAELNNPFGVALDSVGNFYIADFTDNRIRKVRANKTFPATGIGQASASQNFNVELTSASAISSITVPKAQNGAQEFIVGAVTGCATNGTSNPVDTICTVPIKFNPQYPGSRAGELTLYSGGGTILGTVGLVGTGDGPLGVFSPGTTSVVGTSGLHLSRPNDVAVDGAGNVYIGDTSNNRVVRVSVAGIMSVVSTGSLALSNPYGVAVDGAGNIYIVDNGNKRVLESMPGGGTSVLSTGSLTLSNPIGATVDNAGNLYIADAGNNRVVEVTPVGGASVLNTGSLTLNFPTDVAVDSAGDVYITDDGDGRVVEVTSDGVASVLSTGSLTLGTPNGVAVDGAGNIYISDTGNSRVMQVTPVGMASILSTGNQTLNQPFGVAVDGMGDVYIVESNLSSVLEVNQSQSATLIFSNTDTGNSSVQKLVTVQNIGNQPLDLSALNTTTNFNLNGATTCDSTTTLAAGATCDLGVEFLPTAAGSLSGTVNITDNSLNSAAPNNVQQISLNGTGTGFTAILSLKESGTIISYGTPITVTATLTGANGTPAGNITYTLDGVLQPSVALSSGGVANFTLPTTLSGGLHSVTVSYSGDANYTLATLSQSVNLLVNNAPTTTVLTTSAKAIVAGQSVALTATVKAGAVLVTSGTVTFSSGSNSIGAATLNAQGEAILDTTLLPVGANSITASLVGSTDDAMSSSSAVMVTVTAATTAPAPTVTPTLSAASLSLAPGASGSVTLTVAPVGGYTGTLQFFCANLPVGATCSFTPTTLTLSATSGVQTLQVTVKTTGTATLRPYAPFADSGNLPLLATVFWMPGWLLTGMAGLRKKTSVRVQHLLVLLLLLGGVGMLTACGGSAATPTASTSTNNPTPAGSSAVQVVMIGTGNLSQVVALNLTVQ